MRILLITGSFPPMKCGVGDYTACLAEALAKREATNIAVLTDVGASADASKANFEIFPIIRGWKVSEFFQVAKVIRHWHPDIVHIQYPTQGYVGRGRLPMLLPSLLPLLNVKIVQTWHEYYTKESIARGLLPNMLAPGGLVVVRPDYKAHMPPFYRWLVQHKRFRFIPNASTIPRVNLSNSERIAIHNRFTSSDKSLLVFFGFMYPHKGVEFLFEIADPSKHHITLIGFFNDADPYYKAVMKSIEQGPWIGKVTVAGCLPSIETAKILAAADAVVLPFRNGGGMWNTSIHAAAIQGTFVLTTSRERHGYEASENIYYAQPEDIEDMRQALILYIGRKNSDNALSQYATWDSIAKTHIDLYHVLLS